MLKSNNTVKQGTKEYLFLKNKYSKSVIVIFSAASKTYGKFGFYNIASELSNNYNVLLVADWDTHWYLNGIEGFGQNVDDSIHGIEKLLTSNGITEIITIGGSMGGYGAILYGIKLGSSKIIAMGPDIILKSKSSFSIDMLKIVPPDKYKSLVDPISSYSGNMLILVGESSLDDMVQISEIVDFNINIKVVKNAWHSIPIFLGELNILKIFIDECILRSGFPEFKLLKSFDCSKKNIQFFYKIVNSEKDIEDKVELLVLNENSFSTLTHFYFFLSKYYTQVGKLLEAKKILQKGLIMYNYDIQLLVEYGKTLYKLEAYNESEMAFMSAVSKSYGAVDNKIFFHLAKLYFKIKKFSLSNQYIEKALNNDKDDQMYILKARNLFYLEQFDEALFYIEKVFLNNQKNPNVLRLKKNITNKVQALAT